MQAFLENLALQFQKRSTKDTLFEMRKAAWKRFHHIKLPTKKEGAFQYLPLSEFYAQENFFSSSSHSLYEQRISSVLSENEHTLIFVDGVFCPEESNLPASMVVLPLASAMLTFGHFLHMRFSENLKKEKDPFALLNAALQEQGVFIYVPPRLILEKPVKLLHFFTRSAAPCVQIFMGAGSHVKWQTHFRFYSKEPCWINAVMDIALEVGAQLEHFDFSQGKETDWIFQGIRASLKQNCRLQAVNVSKGARMLRHDFRISLQEERAEASLEGLWDLTGKRQGHTHVLMEHLAPHCRSFQRFKGVLNEAGQSSFEGKIYVDQKAQKTDAYQLNQYLLLDDRAIARAKPNLEIFADDVKASHGATVGKLDEKQLFYLRTRGLLEEEARDLLVAGFCQEILSKLP
jgi:Fe-S cluster assembly protein SufD